MGGHVGKRVALCVVLYVVGLSLRGTYSVQVLCCARCVLFTSDRLPTCHTYAHAHACVYVRGVRTHCACFACSRRWSIAFAHWGLQSRHVRERCVFAPCRRR